MTPGTRIGIYEIVAAIGAGGMGEVYRARDTKLGRDVALKILPESFSHDADRVMRFEREAKTLASLNHPQIAQIYGVDDRVLIMELVDGVDLAQWIARGPVPIDEAMAIARQVAEALEAAHDAGIIHRDLKPANIKVRDDGIVKVLDFGLAKLAAPAKAGALAESGRPHHEGPGFSRAITSPAMTHAGMILGTAAYMSPEQAKGKSVDKRADIWAYGCVLYEMLSGRRAFAGEDVTDTLTAIMRDTPKWDALPPATPVSLHRLIERCLERDPKQRLRDIGEARVLLTTLQAGNGREEMVTVAAAVAPSPWRTAVPWGLFVLASIALAIAIVRWPSRAEAPSLTLRALVKVDPAVKVLPPSADDMADTRIALSPDGTTLVFSGLRGTTNPRESQLFVRRLDQFGASALTGTDEGVGPFFSPDGQWVGFFAQGKLKKVTVAGGPVTTVAENVWSPRGGVWLDDGTIIYAPMLGLTGMMRVDANGGTPKQFTTPSAGIVTQRWPQSLPGSSAILFTANRDLTAYDRADLMVAPLNGGPAAALVRNTFGGRYLGASDPRDGGYLLFVSQGKLVAQQFDVRALRVSGEPVTVVEDLEGDSNTGVANFSVSANGTLAYIPGTMATQQNPIDWMTSDGHVTPLRRQRADWESISFSPDGRRLAMDGADGGQRDIYVYEWERDRLTQLTFDASNEWAPVWTPDGRRVTFASDRATKGVGNLYSVNADGTGQLERLTESANDQRPGSWHPNGNVLVFEESTATGASRVMAIERRDGTGKPSAPSQVAEAPGVVAAPSFSADGRFIAFSGYAVIEVRSYPATGGQWRIANRDAAGVGLAMLPRWSPRGDALFFVNGRHVFRTPYAVVGQEFRAETPAQWSPTEYVGMGLRGAQFAVHPDGKRVAILAHSSRTFRAPDALAFVFDFQRGLTTLFRR